MEGIRGGRMLIKKIMIKYVLPLEPTAAASCISAAVGISGVVLIGPGDKNSKWLIK